MHRLIFAIPCLLLSQCEQAETNAAVPVPDPPAIVDESTKPADHTNSVVRITVTRQRWNPGQPWEKQAPRKRGSLGAIIEGEQIITTAEMIADATFIELETTDGLKRIAANPVAVDYEANLALLVAETSENGDFFDSLTPLNIASTPPVPGDMLKIIQIEDNGNPITTCGPVQSVDVVSSFLSSQFFLTYEVKASMQSAASSFTLPVLFEGELAGLLTSYNSEDQLSQVGSTEVLNQFLKDASDGEYVGFPSLGVSTSSTEDSNFREYLQLSDEVGGIYVSKIVKGGSAEKAGMEVGDVITEADSFPIDRLGYFEHDRYGRLFWSHLVRGSKATGKTVSLKILRDGEPQLLEVTLERRSVDEQLVPSYTFGKAPNYLIKGGMVFQELSQPLLESFGEEWQTRAPLDLLNAWQNPSDHEEDADRIVFLAGVIATPATVGYEPLRNLIVEEVNGVAIRDMKGLLEAFNKPPADGLHAIAFRGEGILVHLDEVTATAVDTQLMQRGINQLSRAE